MPFKLPSLDDSRDFLVALYRSLFPTANVGSRRSYHGRRATYLAGAITQLHAHVDSAQRDAHPLTAGDGKPILDWGNAVGVPKKTATPARQLAAGRVTGAATTTATAGLQLQHVNTGLLFKLNSNVTIPGIITDPDSFADADIVGIDTGSQTRLLAGEVLNFLAPPAGIQTAVVLQKDLDLDGFDAEQFGSYRGRVLSTFSQTPSGGNQADFVKWALASLNTVATAYAYPERAGRGTIDVVAFYAGVGAARTMTSTDLATVKAYIQTLAPFQVTGTGGGLRMLTTIPDPRNIEIRLTSNGQAAFAFDWDDSAAFTVSAFNPTTRELTFSATLPASLHAGHRLSFQGVATAQDGTEFHIESISASNKVILQEQPTIAPAAPDKIFSGGPLVTPVRDAIVGHLAGEIVYAGRGLTPLRAGAVQSVVGLDVLADGLGSANPGGIYNNSLSWSGGVVRATLFKIAMFKAGVGNAVITTPAADYEAVDDAFPLDAQIHYVTPGSVLIRRA